MVVLQMNSAKICFIRTVTPQTVNLQVSEILDSWLELWYKTTQLF